MTSVPSTCYSIGSTDDCEIHGLVRYASNCVSGDVRDISLLTVQGHPEFNPDVTVKIIDDREGSGVFDKALAEQSRAYAQMHDDGIWFGGLALKIMGL